MHFLKPCISNYEAINTYSQKGSTYEKNILYKNTNGIKHKLKETYNKCIFFFYL